MKKIFFFLAVVVVLVVAACQKAPSGVSDKNLVKSDEQIVANSDATGNAAVDSIGSDLSDADAAEKDLTESNIEDIDSGLQDIENI